MPHHPKWVLSCKNCRAECIYAHIPEDAASFFLPKKPNLPDDFTFKCTNCGHTDTYQRKDLSYRDDSMPSYFQSSSCVSK